MRTTLRSAEVVLPVASLGLVVATFLASPWLITGRYLTGFDLYNALQGLSAVGFVALALGLTMIAGEYDLSVAGTSAVGGMIAVSTGQQSGVQGVAVAVAVGVGIGLVQGLIITRFRISTIPVTLGTYIALLGLTNSLGGGQTRTYANPPVTLWVDQPVLVFFSPRSLMCIGLFVVAALVLGGTKLGRELRAIGGDRRASRVVGIRVDASLVVLLGTSGALAALGGALASYSFASASPNPGTRILVLGTVAALLGGVSLSGGRGRPLGLLAGALSVALIAQIVVMAALPDFYTQLFYALLLAVVVALDAPGLRRQVVRWRSRRAPARIEPVTFSAPGR